MFADSEICYEERQMIEGTRPFRGKNTSLQADATATENASRIELHDAQATSETTPNAMNKSSVQMDRREWFSSLVPAFGDGLVKILRASNHLRD